MKELTIENGQLKYGRNKWLKLEEKELDVITHLLEAKDFVETKQIARKFWGDISTLSVRTANLTVGRLNKKLWEFTDNSYRINTETDKKLKLEPVKKITPDIHGKDEIEDIKMLDVLKKLAQEASLKVQITDKSQLNRWRRKINQLNNRQYKFYSYYERKDKILSITKYKDREEEE